MRFSWRNLAIGWVIVLIVGIAWALIATALGVGATPSFVIGMVIGGVSMIGSTIRFPPF